MLVYVLSYLHDDDIEYEELLGVFSSVFAAVDFVRASPTYKHKYMRRLLSLDVYRVNDERDDKLSKTAQQEFKTSLGL